MKRYRLPLVTFFTLLLTGGFLILGNSHHSGERHGLASPGNPLESTAAWRWRTGQPSHWHACLLHQ